MATAGAIGAAAAAGAFFFDALPATLEHSWTYAVLLAALGIAQVGVRLGRKTYLIDAAPAGERPLYVAFANTVAGVVALVGGLFGVLADFVHVRAVLGGLSAVAACGALASYRLPPAARMTDG